MPALACAQLAPFPALVHARSSFRSLSTASSVAQRPGRCPTLAAKAVPRTPLPPLAEALPLAAALAAVGIAAPAGAEEGVQQAAFGGAPAAEASAAAAAALESDPTDLLFSVLFTIAVAALTVVTLGVGYLSFTSWNDSRIENEDRRRVDSFRPGANSTAPSKKAAAKAAVKAEKAAEEFKGFGKK